MKVLTYGVRELQENLGAALRAAQAGTDILITSHGKPVALLTKPDGRMPRESVEDRKLRRLAAQGKIILGKPGPIPPLQPLPLGGITAQVLADRR
jgi:antitoxin (DNA-binding transcriptional repressor) of toxin-antitoxin stability system